MNRAEPSTQGDWAQNRKKMGRSGDSDEPAAPVPPESPGFRHRTEAPLLERAAKRYDDRVVFIGVDVRDFNGDAKNFVEKHGLT